MRASCFLPQVHIVDNTMIVEDIVILPKAGCKPLVQSVQSSGAVHLPSNLPVSTHCLT